MIKPVPSTHVAQLIRDVSACSIAGSPLSWGANYTNFFEIIGGPCPPVDFFIGNLYLFISKGGHNSIIQCIICISAIDISCSAALAIMSLTFLS